MVLTYFGDGCVRFQSGERSLLVDPVNNRLKADATIRTLVPSSVSAAPEGEVLYPGEYEVGGMEITGWGVNEESTAKFLKSIFLVRWEEITIGLLGHVAQVPDASLLEGVGGCDVLVLPVGEHFLSVTDAAKIAKQIEPHIIVPTFIKKPAEFLKTMGQKADEEEKFVFKKKDIMAERERIIVLKAA